MALFSNTATLLGKELRTEFRSRELLTTTSVFILIVLVLFSFATNPGTEEARQFAPGLLWLAILFPARASERHPELSPLSCERPVCHFPGETRC